MLHLRLVLRVSCVYGPPCKSLGLGTCTETDCSLLSHPYHAQETYWPQLRGWKGPSSELKEKKKRESLVNNFHLG